MYHRTCCPNFFIPHGPNHETQTARSSGDSTPVLEPASPVLPFTAQGGTLPPGVTIPEQRVKMLVDKNFTEKQECLAVAAEEGKNIIPEPGFLSRTA